MKKLLTIVLFFLALHHYSFAEVETLGCGDYLAIPTANGILFNNVWNKHAAGTDKWTQCLEQRTVNGTVQYGWSWNWPRGRQVIYAYPQIKLGASPWAPEPAMDTRFPVKISTLKRFEVSYEVETTSDGDHNLATSMWLTKSPVKDGKPEPSAITTEVMIWTYSTKEHFNPAGKKHGTIKTGDSEWEVWLEKNWKDVSGQNRNRWVYLTFRAKTHSLKAEIDIRKLLDYAIAEQIITSDLYVADVELGNEIMSGSGVTWVHSFQIEIY